MLLFELPPELLCSVVKHLEPYEIALLLRIGCRRLTCRLEKEGGVQKIDLSDLWTREINLKALQRFSTIKVLILPPHLYEAQKTAQLWSILPASLEEITLVELRLESFFLVSQEPPFRFEAINLAATLPNLRKMSATLSKWKSIKVRTADGSRVSITLSSEDRKAVFRQFPPNFEVLELRTYVYVDLADIELPGNATIQLQAVFWTRIPYHQWASPKRLNADSSTTEATSSNSSSRAITKITKESRLTSLDVDTLALVKSFGPAPSIVYGLCDNLTTLRLRSVSTTATIDLGLNFNFSAPNLVSLVVPYDFLLLLQARSFQLPRSLEDLSIIYTGVPPFEWDFCQRLGVPNVTSLLLLHHTSIASPSTPVPKMPPSLTACHLGSGFLWNATAAAAAFQPCAQNLKSLHVHLPSLAMEYLPPKITRLSVDRLFYYEPLPLFPLQHLPKTLTSFRAPTTKISCKHLQPLPPSLTALVLSMVDSVDFHLVEPYLASSRAGQIVLNALTAAAAFRRYLQATNPALVHLVLPSVQFHTNTVASLRATHWELTYAAFDTTLIYALTTHSQPHLQSLLVLDSLSFSVMGAWSSLNALPALQTLVLRFYGSIPASILDEPAPMAFLARLTELSCCSTLSLSILSSMRSLTTLSCCSISEDSGAALPSTQSWPPNLSSVTLQDKVVPEHYPLLKSMPSTSMRALQILHGAAPNFASTHTLFTSLPTQLTRLFLYRERYITTMDLLILSARLEVFATRFVWLHKEHFDRLFGAPLRHESLQDQFKALSTQPGIQTQIEAFIRPLLPCKQLRKMPRIRIPSKYS